MGGAAGCTPAAVFVWCYSYGYRSEEREGFEGSHCFVSHCHTTDGHRLHLGYVLADGSGLCHYPSYGSTCHGRLWRIVDKPCVCGGLLINRLVREDDVKEDVSASCQVDSGNRIWRVLKYAYYDMLRDIGLRLLIGLVVAALIQVAVPDEFFLSFGSQPLLQMLVILVIAVPMYMPMYICSTGSIPVAAALMMKGLSPGAALVMLMAGPAVNLASILVVHKSMGRRFTSIYLMTIVGFAVLFGLLLNATGWDFTIAAQDACCMSTSALPSPFKIVCATVLTLLIIFALMMKFFSKFTAQKPLDPDVTVYRVEDMHCSHCEAAVVRAVENLPGVEKAKASASANTLTIKGPATEETIRTAVEGIGYTFKGRSSESR